MRKQAGSMKIVVAMSVVALAAWVIQAGPGQGIHSGPWMISPYVQETATYDSTIDQSDDWFLHSEAGVRAGYSAFMIEGSALGYGAYRNYADATDKDFASFGEVVSVKYGLRERLQVQADESFRHAHDTDSHGSEGAIGGVSADSVLDAATRAERNLTHAGLSLGRDMTDKLEVDLGIRYDGAAYPDEVDLADLSGESAQLEGAYRVTAKSAAVATLFCGREENSVLDGSADYYGVRLGAKTRGTDKVSIKAGAGVKQYDRAGNGEGDAAFSFDAMAAWVVTDKVLLRAGGRNGTMMSSVLSDNASDYTAVWAGALYQVIPTVGLSVNGIYRIDEYLDPVKVAGGGTVDRKDKGTGLNARADYQTPAAFLKLYAEASYEATDSNVSNFDQTRVTVGANVKY